MTLPADSVDFAEAADQAVHDALAQVCAEHGRVLTDFVGLATFLLPDGGVGYAFVTPDGQTVAQCLGLAVILEEWARGNVRRNLDCGGYPDDDEDG